MGCASITGSENENIKSAGPAGPLFDSAGEVIDRKRLPWMRRIVACATELRYFVTEVEKKSCLIQL